MAAKMGTCTLDLLVGLWYSSQQISAGFLSESLHMKDKTRTLLLKMHKDSLKYRVWASWNSGNASDNVCHTLVLLFVCNRVLFILGKTHLLYMAELAALSLLVQLADQLYRKFSTVPTKTRGCICPEHYSMIHATPPYIVHILKNILKIVS